MIRQLLEKDKQMVLDYLSDEPALNLFMIGDIESLGMESAEQKVFGEFLDNELITVLLNYKEVNLIIYTKSENSLNELIPFIKTQTYSFISGAKRITDYLSPKLSDHKCREMYFCERKPDGSFLHNNGVKEISNRMEIEEEYELLISIEELTGMKKNSKEAYIKSKEDTYFKLKTGIGFYIRNNEEIVAAASTAAETKSSAMIIGVGTHLEHRKKGYATTILKEIINRYNIKGKSLCLFYDNPEAGRIYKSLGFTDIDKWVMMDKEK